MDKVRITEIAKELGIKSKNVIENALRMGLDIKSASSSITTDDAEALMHYILTGEQKPNIQKPLRAPIFDSKLLEISNSSKEEIRHEFALYPSTIENIEIEIINTKNIKNLKWTFPYKANIYAIIGENGSGKSTFITSLAKLVQPSVLKSEFIGKGYEESQIIYSLNNYSFTYIKNPNWNLAITPNTSFLKLDGFYESSVLNGNRFKKVDYFFRNLEIENGDVITDATLFIKENMNYILSGHKSGKFDNLKKISAKRKRKKNNSEQFEDVPYSFYAIKNESMYIKEFFLSTGEYFLLSILKFLSLLSTRESLKPNIIIIDEIEISLHPLAQKRFIEKLIEFKKTFNLLIIFATHSLHIIDNMSPNDIYYLEKNTNGDSIFHSPIYPAYLHSKLYSNTLFDKVILTEDRLAKTFIEEIISTFSISKMRYTILPIGGWQKVIEIHKMHENQNIFGCAKLISVLDGDTVDKLEKSHKKVQHTFLPIHNVEYVVTNYLSEQDKEFLYFLNRKIAPHDYNELKIEVITERTEDRKNTYCKLLNEISRKNFNKDVIENNIIQYIVKDKKYSDSIIKFQKALEYFFELN